MAILEKAKQLKEQAALAATELAGQASQRASEMKDDVATKAAQAKEQAAEKAAKVKENVASAASEMKDGVASAAASAKESVVSAAIDAKDSSVARAKATIDDFNEAIPIISEAGYSITGVDIGVGIPPKVSASVAVSGNVTAERIEAVLEAHPHKPLTGLIVRSLYQAWRLQSSISIVGMKPRGMSIELGLVPSVSIKFAPADPPAATAPQLPTP